jgi:plastocyanin
MSNETLFYVFGIALAVSAVLVSIAGLRLKDFPGKAFPVVVLWFAILVGGAATFAVLHAKDEETEKSAEFEKAGKEIEKEQSSGPYEGDSKAGGDETEPENEESKAEGGEASGPGGTLALEANPTELKYDKTSLSSKPGEVTIDFTNPATLEHDVSIEQEGEELGSTEIIGEGEASTTVALPAGTYTFFCSVPGHREAGMEGTLTVK